MYLKEKLRTFAMLIEKKKYDFFQENFWNTYDIFWPLDVKTVKKIFGPSKILKTNSKDDFSWTIQT